MPEPRFKAGDRVVAIEDERYPGPWRGEPVGTVIEEPMIVDTSRGPEHSYWISFDQPQRDLAGDGPYERSQIVDRYLLRAEPAERQE